LLVIDPGPAIDEHLESIAATAGDSNVVAVLLTHHHPDHAESAERCSEMLGTVIASAAEPARPSDIPVADGQRVGGDGVFLTALATPGHASDHLCFLLEEERTLFTGDHVLGRGHRSSGCNTSRGWTAFTRATGPSSTSPPP
jgi:glyoxylase-like metal-dependent hydrolase (beta-lactamase superfamily II)